MKTATRKKSKLDSLLDSLADLNFDAGLTDATYSNLLSVGLSSKNLPLAAVAARIALDEHPLTLRGLFYRVVSAGVLPSTDKENYNRLGRVMTTLREKGLIPFSWLVDNLRSTVKPSSWSGLADFADTCRDSYRLDFWARLPDYVHIFCEKDAIAGVISPVTRKYDVALSPLRGYTSLSFAAEIASQWNKIDKPISAYYLGDYDPSGFDLERDCREKLERYCDHNFHWTRLGVHARDFFEFNLLPLEVKTSDKRAKTFIEDHGENCAELDAIPAVELRRRVQDAIEHFIPQEEWARLQAVEAAERETFSTFISQMQSR